MPHEIQTHVVRSESQSRIHGKLGENYIYMDRDLQQWNPPTSRSSKWYIMGGLLMVEEIQIYHHFEWSIKGCKVITNIYILKPHFLKSAVHSTEFGKKATRDSSLEVWSRAYIYLHNYTTKKKVRTSITQNKVILP